MPRDTTVTISEDLVEQWLKEAEELDRQAARLRRKASGAQLVLEAEKAEQAREYRGEHDLEDLIGSEIPESFMGAIRFFANNAPAPLSKDALRKLLLDNKFPETSVNGQYFYVAISNLKKAGDISVDSNGAVGAAKKN